jgi:hypothetical protein
MNASVAGAWLGRYAGFAASAWAGGGSVALRAVGRSVGAWLGRGTGVAAVPGSAVGQWSRRGLSGPWPGTWTPLWSSLREFVCQLGPAGRWLQRRPCGRQAVPPVRVTKAGRIGTPAPRGTPAARVSRAAGFRWSTGG